MAFTHLHVHTEYSLLDGAARIKKLVSKVKELGMDSIAITDHGAMFGVIEFYKECINQGVKPLIGCEVYTAARKMTDKTADKDKYQGHLVLIAENNEGYQNLIKIVSLGYTKGYYYKPRIDKDVLRQYSKGIIALSACLAGRVQNALLNRDYERAKREALELNDIFGSGNFFLEMQDQGLEEELLVNEGLIKLSKDTGIPLVATNDVHYVNQEDSEFHDVLLAIQMATTVDDEKRMRFPNDQFYLKSEDEMRKIFAFAPEAIDNTAEIAKRCNVEFKFGEYHLPEFNSPEGFTNSQYLRKLCEEGLKDRYEIITDQLKDRLNYEIDVIETMGYVEYFLIVWDFINYAKEHGIVVGPGRGSAAGSIVAYSLKITDIDPIKNKLIFERFLNPERVSMPDIDIDFCIERRGEVLDYVKRKYGNENVSQIITFGRMMAKAAVRDVGRALNMSYAEADRIAKEIPFGPKMTIKKAFELNPTLKEMYDQELAVKKVLDMAMAIEGMPRHASTHAAGVVITKKPVDEYVPLYMSDKGVATQFTMTTIEELGLLKMDFLGLRNLTVIRDALELIKQNYGVELDFSKIGFDDHQVYEMISKGNTDGVFQLESSGMTSFMKNLKPSCFEDVVAGIALFRPGPMDSIDKYIEYKKHPEIITYITPELEPILNMTYGCIVYQEQVMQIVRDLAGYSYGRSDLVRRAMGKKDPKVMMQEKQYFIYGKTDENGNEEACGCIKNGITEEAAEMIFDEMVSFADYAFNKSHAVAYAVLSYQTGFLKRHYPVEFMAALMTSVMGDTAHISKYIRNCQEMGIEVLPPCVNESQMKFSVKDGKIRFGLLAVKGVGEGAIKAIIKAREEKGIPKDMGTFINNLEISEINKKAIDSLIKAGAMDCFNPNRAMHLAAYESILESAQNNARKNLSGQMSLFQTSSQEMNAADITGRLPNVENFERKILLAMEKEVLGVYITDHPLNDYKDIIRRITSVNCDDLMQIAEGESFLIHDGDTVVMAGMVTGFKKLITKNSKMMAFVDLEDLYGTVEVVVFPNVYEKFYNDITNDSIIAVRGKLNFKEEEMPKLLADSIVKLDNIADPKNPFGLNDSKAREKSESRSHKGEFYKKGNNPVKIRIPKDANEQEILVQLKKVFAEFRGNVPVLIYLQNGKIVGTGNGPGVRPCLEFAETVADMVGNANIKIEVIAR